MARIRTRSWGRAWLALFEAEQKNIDTALQAETRLSDAVEDAEAAIDIVDDSLNALAGQAGSLVRLHYRGKQRDDVMAALFGSQFPSEFVKPLLGEQLEAMAKWPEILKTLTVTALSDLAPKVEAAVKQADTALEALGKAEASLMAFRTGVRQPLVKKVDGMRHQLLGEARKQARDSGDPREAEGLFLRSVRRRPAETSLALARAELAACEQDVAAAKQRLAALEEAERAAEQRRAQRRVDEDRLAALLKQQAETEAAIAQARANLRADR
jgi:hypothetical protein